LIGWAALRTHALSRALGFCILAYGTVSIFTFAFAVSKSLVGGAINGLLSLIVFLWLGVALLRQQQPKPSENEMTTARG